jgi:multiple sugar transport system permease protein
VLAALDVWRSVGFWAIFFLAAVIGLPRELYQAAELDGANAWQRFLRLTLPLLRRVILFAVVVATIYGLQVFETALILTEGGPGTATLTVVYRIWTYIFGSTDKVGYGAAMSVALLLAILVLTVIQLRLLRGQRGED